MQIAFIALTSQLFSHLRYPKLFGDVLSLYTAVDDELYADDYTGASSCRHYCTSGSYDYSIMMTSHCEVLADEILADEILADCTQNYQSTKINSLPKFLATWYIIRCHCKMNT